MLCGMDGNGNGTGGAAAVAGAGCNNNWSTSFVGSRLQWDVTKSFYLGIEGIYDHMDSASITPSGALPAGSPLAFGAGAPYRAARQHLDGQRPYAQGLPALIV